MTIQDPRRFPVTVYDIHPYEPLSQSPRVVSTDDTEGVQTDSKSKRSDRHSGKPVVTIMGKG